MTIEPPRGLKNNLKQTFGPGGIVNKKTFESNDYGEHWKRLLFSVGFIHALIQERKKFGPLGWNLPYEFNSSDLEVLVLQLQNILPFNKTNVPFNVLKYISGQVIYGGKKQLFNNNNNSNTPSIFHWRLFSNYTQAASRTNTTDGVCSTCSARSSTRALSRTSTSTARRTYCVSRPPMKYSLNFVC